MNVLHKSQFLNYIEPFFKEEPVIVHKEKGEWKGFTIKELKEKSTQIANAIFNSGIQKGDRILTILDNSCDWYCWDIAIGSVGAIHVPVSNSMHREDIYKITLHSSPKLIVVLKKRHFVLVEQYVSNSDARIIFIQGDNGSNSFEWFTKKSSSFKFEFDVDLLSENDPATIIYRSDTLQHLNGVVLSHKSQFLNAFSVSRTVSFGKRSCYFQFLPMSSAFVISSGYISLIDGIPLYIWDGVTPLHSEIKEINPEIITIVPFFLKRAIGVILRNARKKNKLSYVYLMLNVRLATHISTNTRNPILRFFVRQIIRNALIPLKKEFGLSMKRIICGGAPVSVKTTRLYSAAGIPIYQGYGLTELGTGVSICPPEIFPEGSSGKIIDIVDIQISAEGEILCKSKASMSGFYLSIDLNAFNNHGFYSTGDIGYKDSCNYLFLKGRKKSICKLSSGLYVEPVYFSRLISEIEHVGYAHMVCDNKDIAIAIISVVPSETILLKMEEQEKFIRKEIDRLYNDHVVPAKRIATILFTRDNWTIENGEIDSNGIPVSIVIEKKYRKQINQLYKNVTKRVYL